MALRFDFPTTAVLPDEDRPLTRLSAMREPLDVEYRGHLQGEQVTADVVDSGYCRILGRTAIGKSSVLPKLLAKHSGNTVVVVTGHPLLARAGYNFFKENPRHVVDSSDMKACLMQDQSLKIREYNLVWASASHFVAWLFARSMDTRGQDILKDVIVVLDEAHEPDAYTHVVRNTAKQLGAKSLALVSATFEPAGHSVNTAKVSIKKYPVDKKPSTWSADQPGMPWHYGAIKTSALMYVEFFKDAERLVREYISLGFFAHRLDSKTSAKDFDRAMRDLADDNGPPVVLIVDRSYRSGFNFDVGVVIDSGDVHYVNGEGTELSLTSRRIYNVELVQTAGRAGRFGKLVSYYMPDFQPQWKICDIERVEMEASALFIRLLGYLPIKETADTVMTYDNLPIKYNLRDVLNGPFPLPQYCRDEFGQRKTGTREVAIPPIRIVPISRGNSVASGATRRSVVPTKAQIDAALSVRSARKPTCETSVGTKAPSAVSGTLTGFSCLDADIPSLSLNRPVKSTVCNIKPSDSVSNIGETVAPGSVVSTRVSSAINPSVHRNVSSSTIELPRPNDMKSRAGRTELTVGTSLVSDCPDDVWSVLAEQLCLARAKSAPDNGAYLSCPGIDKTKLPEVSRYFPEKEKSVLDMAVEKSFKATVKTLSSRHLKFGLHHAISRYNKLNLEIRSVKSAFEQLVADGYVASDFSRIKTEFSDIVSQVASWEMEREALRAAIIIMSGAVFTLTEVKTVESAERDRVALYVKKFRKQLTKSNRLSDQAREGIFHNATQEPLMLEGPMGVTRVDRRRSRRSSSTVARETIYIKPVIGVSTAIDKHDGKIQVKPSRIVRKLTGCEEFTLSNVKVK